MFRFKAKANTTGHSDPATVMSVFINECLKAFDSLCARYEYGIALLERANLHYDGKKRDEAVADATHALHIFEVLGASPYARSAQEFLGTLGSV